VIDANILIRATLGVRARDIIEHHRDRVEFIATDTSFADARKYLPVLMSKHGKDPAPVADMIDHLATIVLEVGRDFYRPALSEAMVRISRRDPDDAPILAAALVLDCPVWTEDQDFFGTGVATWTTDRVELYFRNLPNRAA
jgi:predicted nucleic acid-binding protein